MRISQVSVSNWRNFKQIDFQLADRLIVVGPNAAGKSNLLDIFRFLGEVAQPGGGLAASVERRGGISKIRSLFARNSNHGRVTIDIRLADEDDTWRYRISFKAERSGLHRPIVEEERVERNGTVIIDRPDASDRSDPERLTQTHLEQIATNQKFRPVADYFSRVRYFHLVPQIIRDPGRTVPLPGDPYGAEFIAEMNSVPTQTRNAWLRRMEDALRSAVPEFKELKLEIDSSGKPHLVAGYQNWREHPARQSEADFSDGTLRLIGLLWTIISAPKNGGVLLLEEPELSLNSAIVRTLPSVLAMARRAQSMQVVMSTHAPELLDDEGVSPSEILVVRVTKEGSDAALLDQIPEVAGEVAADLPKSMIVNGLIAPRDLSGLVAVGRRGRS